MSTIVPLHAAAKDELFDKAAAALRRTLAVEPRNAAALARLGDLERARGDFAAALTAYRRLLAVAPDDAEAAWTVAVLGGDRLPGARHGDELFDKAAAALRRTLAVEPRNAAALARLGDLERARGDFAAALTAYRRLLAVAPGDASAAWAVAVLGGDRLPEVPPPAGRIAPFVRMTDFLPPAARDRLLQDVLAASERFAPAKVGADAITVNLKARNALVLDEPTTRNVRSWFVPKLRAVLPEVLRRLRMEDLDPRRIELRVTVHLNGGFYVAHRDDSLVGNSRDRLVSWVCYFHRAPKRFAGGDLLLHDAGRAGESPSRAFSRIEPLCDSIVFFPSDCLHEIIPVACGAEFGDGRFTVNGWVHGVRRRTGAREAEC